MSVSTTLGDFLRTRRASLTPEAAGLSHTKELRRVPGLRREEVAQLAAISTDYYTRLEQGRIRPSASVVASLVRALQLNDEEGRYLAQIAGVPTPSARPVPVASSPELQWVLDSLEMSPAFAIGPRTEVLAWNDLGAVLFTDFNTIPPEQRYFVRMLFTDPRMRELYADWADVARLAVEQMRRLNPNPADDPILTGLVTELSAVDADFATWWHDHNVAPRTTGMKKLNHPVVGELELSWSALTWNADPSIQLIVWTAPPNSASYQRLSELRSYSA